MKVFKVIIITIMAVLLLTDSDLRAQCADGVTQCPVTILCDDVYGDGWNGAAVQVWQGSTLRGIATLTAGNYGEVEVNICADDTIRFVWQSGQLDGEIFLTILNGDGSVIAADLFGADLINGQTIATALPACPSCVHPAGLLSTYDSSTATVSWTPMSGESSWLLQLNQNAPFLVNATSYTFTGLTVNSDYTVGVRALCGDGDTSDVTYVQFHTGCGPLQVPYFNNFDSETIDALPHCWNGVTMYGNSPKVFDDYAYSDSLALYFGATHDYNLVTTPLVPLPGNEIAVNFYGFIENGLVIQGIPFITSWLKAGVMSDLSDPNTFIPLVDVDTMDNNWHEYEFNTASLNPSMQYYVAFKFYGDDYMWGNASIDDLSITRYNGCERPQMTYIDSVGSHNVFLSWDVAGVNTTGYDIYYSAENNPQTSTYYTTVYDTFCVVEGLAQQTTYYVWIRTECDTVYSDYKSFAPFTTALSCAPAQNVELYNVSYTAAAIRWQYDTYYGFPATGALVRLYDMSDATAVVQEQFVTENTALFTGLQPGHGYRAYIFSTCQAVGEIDTANAVSIEFMTDACGQIADENHQYASSSYFVGTNMTTSYTQTIYTAAEMPLVDTIYGLAFRSTGIEVPVSFDLYLGHTLLSNLSSTAFVPLSALTLKAAGYTANASSEGWHIIPFDTPFVYDNNQNLVVATYNGSGVFYLQPIEWNYHPTEGTHTFQWNNYGVIDMAAPSTFFTSAMQGAADVRFMTSCEIVGCQAPFITRVDADSNSANVEWIIEGDATTFVVQYRSANESQYHPSGTVVTDNYHTVAGLVPGTNYYLRVGALCGGDTLWNSTMFTTLCGQAHIPYNETFDSYPEYTMPPCWQYSVDRVNHLQGGLAFSAMFTNFSPSLRAAVLPALNQQLSELEISFRAMLGTVDEGYAILIGAAEDDGQNIEWLDTLTSPTQSRTNYTWFSYSFGDYSGDHSRIALSLLSPYENWYDIGLLIDDITVSPTSTCRPPTEMHASGLEDATSIVVTWNNPGNASQFQIAWDTIGTPIGQMTNVLTVGATSYMLPALLSGAKYTFCVRTLCDGDSSVWRSVDFAAGRIIMHANAMDTVTDCGLIIYDDGGANLPYSVSSTSTLVVFPDAPGNAVTFNGGMIDLSEWGGDSICVYEGAAAVGEPLFRCNHTNGALYFDTFIVSEVGPMTFQFVSDFYDVGMGYELVTGCTSLPSCLRPHNIAITNITANSADVAWSGNAVYYDVYYRPLSGGAWSVANATSNSITLIGLSENETYELQIQGHCSGNESSSMSLRRTFATVCVSTMITRDNTLEEDFENPDAPASCFTLVYNDANSTNTMIHSTMMAYSGSRSFRFSSYNGCNDYGQYLITPPFTAYDSVTLRFRYCDQMYGNEVLRVGYSTSGNAPGDIVWVDTVVTSGTTWKLYSRDFPPTAKYLAINYLSVYRYYAYIDSLKISVVPSADCEAPVIEGVHEALESITVDIANASNVEAVITTQPWNDGYTGTMIGDVDSYTFAGLSPNTMYTIGLRNHCANGMVSAWTTRSVRTPVAGCAPPDNFSISDIDFTSATFSWDIDGDATTWEINIYNTAFDRSYIVTESPFRAEGLAQDVAYSARIRSICFDAPGQWNSNTLQFTTPLCEPVSGITYNVVLHGESASVELDWQGTADEYIIEYGPDHFGEGMGTTIEGIEGTHYTIGSLDLDTIYDLYIRSHCAPGINSNWSQCVRIDTHVGIDNVYTIDEIQVSVHPNPTSGIATLTIEGMRGNVQVQVFDLDGRMLIDKRELSLDMRPYGKGVYFVRISSEKGSIVKKLVVK